LTCTGSGGQNYCSADCHSYLPLCLSEEIISKKLLKNKKTAPNLIVRDG